MTTATSKPNPRWVAAVALPILNQLKAHYREWEEQVAADNRRGYSAHYCPEGMDLWVPWDPICGVCEEYGMWYRDLRRIALERAHGAIWLFNARIEALNNLNELGLPADLRERLVTWACEPITEGSNQ